VVLTGHAGVVVRDRQELELRAGLANHLGELRLRERADGLRDLGEVTHVARDRPRVGRYRDGAEHGARVPGKDELRGVVHVQEDEVSWTNASIGEARRETAGPLE